MSSTAANKALIQSFIDRVNDNDLTAASAFMTPDSFHHLSGLGQGDHVGPAAWRAVVEAVRAAFPDRAITVHQMVAENDRVAVRLTWNATHRGAYAGVEATGRAVEVNGFSIFRIANGKISELWVEQDILNLHQQIGAAPGSSHNWPK